MVICWGRNILEVELPHFADGRSKYINHVPLKHHATVLVRAVELAATRGAHGIKS